MPILLAVGLLIFSYLLGAVPTGLIIVKITTGKDIRQVESGRTGGTNVARAAGTWAGGLTAILDMFKAASCVWLARYLFPLGDSPANAWLHVIAPLLAVLGHNYSVFLIGPDANGHRRLRGGAGGAPCAGGSFGLWAPSFLFIAPVAGVFWYFVGYASLATLSVGLLSTVLFTILSVLHVTPWQYALYGILCEIILVWSLRPNITRLMKGNERLVGWRVRGAKAADKKTKNSDQSPQKFQKRDGIQSRLGLSTLLRHRNRDRHQA